MLEVWSISFIWGGLLGAFTDHWAFFASFYKVAALMMLLLSLGLKPHSSWARCCIGVAGCVWGLCHHAPSLSKPDGSFTVQQSGLFPEAYQSMLVANESTVALAFGSGESGSRGYVHARPVNGTLRKFRNSFHKEQGVPLLSPWQQSAQKIFVWWQQTLAKILHPHTAFMRSWLEALFFGRIGELDSSIQEVFKHLGLFHLLIISGMHITFLSNLLRPLLVFPLGLLYVLRICSPRTWLHLQSLGEVLVSLGLVVFVCLIGQPIAAQRALLISSGLHVCQLYLGFLPLRMRLLMVFFIQSLLFPVGLVCESAAMSWLAYMLIICKCPHQTLTRRLFFEIQRQGIILLLAGFLWGQISVGSILINLFVTPCFTPIMFSSFLMLFSSLFPPIFSRINTEVITCALYLLNWIDRLLSTYCPWQYVDQLSYFGRWLLLVASIISLRGFFGGWQGYGKSNGNLQSEFMARETGTDRR